MRHGDKSLPKQRGRCSFQILEVVLAQRPPMNLQEVILTRIARAFPQYSKSKVDAAGATLINEAATGEDLKVALSIINNWRASHSFPLNTFHIGLRRRVASHFPDAITSERIKRLSSIEHKLKRFKTLLRCRTLEGVEPPSRTLGKPFD